MIDHITIYVKNLAVSKEFYLKSLKPLGYKLSFGEEGIFWAFDVGNGCLFEIAQSKDGEVVSPCHVAFRVKNHDEVHSFYEAALSAGGKDNGKPGPIPHYTENYYAAFVHDPDNHNIEVMFDVYE